MWELAGAAARLPGDLLADRLPCVWGRVWEWMQGGMSGLPLRLTSSYAGSLSVVISCPVRAWHALSCAHCPALCGRVGVGPCHVVPCPACDLMPCCCPAMRACAHPGRCCAWERALCVHAAGRGRACAALLLPGRCSATGPPCLGRKPGRDPRLPSLRGLRTSPSKKICHFPVKLGNLFPVPFPRIVPVCPPAFASPAFPCLDWSLTPSWSSVRLERL